MLCGSVEMSGKAPRRRDLLGIYRSPNAALSGEKRGRESPCSSLVRMQPLFPISPRARTDIWQICIYMYLHRSSQTSRCRHNSRIQSGIPTGVSAVTNTHSPWKCKGKGALSSEQITFKPQGGFEQTAYSGTGQVTCSCYSWSVSSKWNGLRADEPRCRAPFKFNRASVYAECWIINYLSSICLINKDLGTFSWSTCDRSRIISRLPGAARGHVEIRSCANINARILFRSLVPFQRLLSRFPLWETPAKPVTTYCKSRMHCLLKSYQIKA